MKSLLVEDNPADARLIREMLKGPPAGTFQVEHVARLAAALERLGQEAFDVVLLDLGLPDSQGLQTLTHAQQAAHGLPIVVLTGLDDEGFAFEAVRAGAQDYLVKGRFDSQLLVRTIRYAIERKRAQEEIRRLNVTLEQRVAERTAAARASEERFRALYEKAPLGIARIDSQTGRFLLINAKYCDILGRTPADMLQLDFQTVTHPEDLQPGLDNLKRLQEGQCRSFEMDKRYLRPNGSIIWVNLTVVPEWAEGEPPSCHIAMVADITARKQADERLKASLHEKEVLLKEIHHRVKNNLQVISSLVDLQTSSLDNPNLRELFKDVRDRVRSMALVHEKLYLSKSMATVDFADYTRSLLNSLAREHRNAATTVGLKLELQPVLFSVETAVPCGLILNELVTNAFKHAFRGRERGEITTALRTGPDGRVCLRVSDNGVGLPAGNDWRQSSSLGLRLIHLLAGQLRAAVEVRSEGGTEFTLTFDKRTGENQEDQVASLG